MFEICGFGALMISWLAGIEQIRLDLSVHHFQLICDPPAKIMFRVRICDEKSCSDPIRDLRVICMGLRALATVELASFYVPHASA